MRILEKLSIHDADRVLAEVNLLEDLTACLGSVHTSFIRQSASTIKERLNGSFVACGWAVNCKVSPDHGMRVNAIAGNIAVQVQFGNIARAFYDMLKLDAMYRSGKIKGACLVVPMQQTARRLGQNLANYERVSSELRVFKKSLAVPIMLLGISQ